MSGQILWETLRVATWLTVAFALWKGDLAARVAAGAFLALEIATMIIRPRVGDVSAETILLAADFACAVIFLLLAVRYANLWLGAAMLFQAAQFSLHAWYLVNELPHDAMHAWINNGDDWGILIAMTVGTILAIRRRIGDRREAAELEARRKQRSAAAP
jgi:signal transduction histidine kinase